MMGQYEIQILDSYDNHTYFDGQAGSIYKQSPPLVNACRKPGEWQTYDIIFKAPRFDDEKQAGQAGLRHRCCTTACWSRTISRSSAARPGTRRRSTTPTAAKRPHPPAVPRQPGAVPQHLGPRNHSVGPEDAGPGR